MWAALWVSCAVKEHNSLGGLQCKRNYQDGWTAALCAALRLPTQHAAGIVDAQHAVGSRTAPLLPASPLNPTAGPAFLAVNFLGGLGGLLSPFEAAAAGFGVLLVRQAVQGPLPGCCGAA